MTFAGAWYMFARSAAWNQSATTNGIGWIALALVVFASWRPLRAIGGAVLFGFSLQVPFTLQAEQIRVLPPTIVAMFPYLITLAVLVVLSTPAHGDSWVRQRCWVNRSFVTSVELVATVRLATPVR